MKSRTFIVREEIADLVGLNAAILHERLKYMVEQNSHEKRKLFDGRAWVDCTYDDWAEYVPVLSVKQIRTAFSRLIDANLVETGRHSKHNTDRKLWYTLSEWPQDVDSPDLPLRANGNAPEGTSTSAHTGTSTSAPEGKSYKEEDSFKNPKDCVSEPHTQFEDFWKVYPRPRDADETRELFFEAVSDGADPRHIIASAKAYAKENEGNSKQYLKLSSTWLEAKGWKDFEAPPPPEDRESLIAKMLASPIPSVQEAARKMQEENAQ